MLYNIKGFVANLVEGNLLIGMDMGTKRIGIAISDKTQKIAMPHLIYTRRNIRKDIGYINELYNKVGACGIIIGIPFSHIRANKWVENIEQFALNIIKKHKINLCLVDESGSTQIALALSHTKRNCVDDVAAAIILQSILNLINDLYR